MDLINEFNEFYMKELSFKSFEDQKKINDWLREKIKSNRLEERVKPKIVDVVDLFITVNNDRMRKAETSIDEAVAIGIAHVLDKLKIEIESNFSV